MVENDLQSHLGHQIDEDLMKYSHPNLANSGKLLQAIYYWIPWNEMIIWVNKQKLAPRSPDDLKTNSEFWSFPYRVVTVEDEEGSKRSISSTSMHIAALNSARCN